MFETIAGFLRRLAREGASLRAIDALDSVLRSFINPQLIRRIDYERIIKTVQSKVPQEVKRQLYFFEDLIEGLISPKTGDDPEGKLRKKMFELQTIAVMELKKQGLTSEQAEAAVEIGGKVPSDPKFVDAVSTAIGKKLTVDLFGFVNDWKRQQRRSPSLERMEEERDDSILPREEREDESVAEEERPLQRKELVDSLESEIDSGTIAERAKQVAELSRSYVDTVPGKKGVAFKKILENILSNEKKSDKALSEETGLTDSTISAYTKLLMSELKEYLRGEKTVQDTGLKAVDVPSSTKFLKENKAHQESLSEFIRMQSKTRPFSEKTRTMFEHMISGMSNKEIEALGFPYGSIAQIRSRIFQPQYEAWYRKHIHKAGEDMDRVKSVVQQVYAAVVRVRKQLDQSDDVTKLDSTKAHDQMLKTNFPAVADPSRRVPFQVDVVFSSDYSGHEIARNEKNPETDDPNFEWVQMIGRIVDMTGKGRGLSRMYGKSERSIEYEVTQKLTPDGDPEGEPKSHLILDGYAAPQSEMKTYLDKWFKDNVLKQGVLAKNSGYAVRYMNRKKLKDDANFYGPETFRQWYGEIAKLDKPRKEYVEHWKKVQLKKTLGKPAVYEDVEKAAYRAKAVLKDELKMTRDPAERQKIEGEIKRIEDELKGFAVSRKKYDEARLKSHADKLKFLLEFAEKEEPTVLTDVPQTKPETMAYEKASMKLPYEIIALEADPREEKRDPFKLDLSERQIQQDKKDKAQEKAYEGLFRTQQEESHSLKELLKKFPKPESAGAKDIVSILKKYSKHDYDRGRSPLELQGRMPNFDSWINPGEFRHIFRSLATIASREDLDIVASKLKDFIDDLKNRRDTLKKSDPQTYAALAKRENMVWVDNPARELEDVNNKITESKSQKESAFPKPQSEPAKKLVEMLKKYEITKPNPNSWLTPANLKVLSKTLAITANRWLAEQLKETFKDTPKEQRGDRVKQHQKEKTEQVASDLAAAKGLFDGMIADLKKRLDDYKGKNEAAYAAFIKRNDVEWLSKKESLEDLKNQIDTNLALKKLPVEHREQAPYALEHTKYEHMLAVVTQMKDTFKSMADKLAQQGVVQEGSVERGLELEEKQKKIEGAIVAASQEVEKLLRLAEQLDQEAYAGTNVKLSVSEREQISETQMMMHEEEQSDDSDAGEKDPAEAVRRDLNRLRSAITEASREFAATKAELRKVKAIPAAPMAIAMKKALVFFNKIYSMLSRAIWFRYMEEETIKQGAEEDNRESTLKGMQNRIKALAEQLHSQSIKNKANIQRLVKNLQGVVGDFVDLVKQTGRSLPSVPKGAPAIEKVADILRRLAAEVEQKDMESIIPGPQLASIRKKIDELKNPVTKKKVTEDLNKVIKNIFQAVREMHGPTLGKIWQDWVNEHVKHHKKDVGVGVAKEHIIRELKRIEALTVHAALDQFMNHAMNVVEAEKAIQPTDEKAKKTKTPLQNPNHPSEYKNLRSRLMQMPGLEKLEDKPSTDPREKEGPKPEASIPTTKEILDLIDKAMDMSVKDTGIEVNEPQVAQYVQTELEKLVREDPDLHVDPKGRRLPKEFLQGEPGGGFAGDKKPSVREKAPKVVPPSHTKEEAQVWVKSILESQGVNLVKAMQGGNPAHAVDMFVALYAQAIDDALQADRNITLDDAVDAIVSGLKSFYHTILSMSATSSHTLQKHKPDIGAPYGAPQKPKHDEVPPARHWSGMPDFKIDSQKEAEKLFDNLQKVYARINHYLSPAEPNFAGVLPEGALRDVSKQNLSTMPRGFFEIWNAMSDVSPTKSTEPMKTRFMTRGTFRKGLEEALKKLQKVEPKAPKVVDWDKGIKSSLGPYIKQFEMFLKEAFPRIDPKTMQRLEEFGLKDSGIEEEHLKKQAFRLIYAVAAKEATALETEEDLVNLALTESA